VDAHPSDPRLLFRGNVTGVRPSGSEDVLDANAALTLALRTLDVDGRVQIVRIGRDHLTALLDAIDPYRENVSVNRVRLGLTAGYPEFVRLVMQEGLMDVKVDLGGAAGAVRIDEIRDIPLAALLERYVAPLVDRALGAASPGPAATRAREPASPSAGAAP
jgi:translocation and assembly module TamB